MLYKDKTGKLIEITKGARFLAKDRIGRIFEYLDMGERYGYEKLLKNLSDNTKTRVVKNWFFRKIY